MANPAPTINQINAFNATQGTTIDFNIIGGTELIRSNRIYIYDLSDNSLICTHLYVSTESIHELPPNTDGSIVYESGKSSADFVNGAQYYAQIQTYTDTNGTQGGSGLSVAKMFWCLGDPTLTITTIPSTISTTSYNISATYTDTSASVVSNIIQQYQFNLYSATGSLLQSSGVVVGSGMQQGTSDVYDISHNFTGLNVGSSYYVTVNVTTTQGMSVNAQSNTFTVSIDTPTLGEATVVNNACDGYISVTSNLSGEYGGSGSGEIVSFETDSENVFSKLQVDLEPTQEGSGNPSPTNVRPIRGHGGVDVNVVGKNLLPFQYAENTITRNGITWTVNDDGTITANGTSTGASWFDVITAPNIFYPKQQVVVSGCPSGGSTSTYRIYINVKTKQGENAGYTDIGSSSIVLDVAEINQIRLQINSAGFVANNLTFKPMIRYASEADSTYEPYNAQTITQDFNVSLTPTSTDTTPYLFKAVGDVYGDRLEDKIVGGTVAWNQQVIPEKRNNAITPDGSVTYSTIGMSFSSVINHVYLCSADIVYNGDKNPLRAYCSLGSGNYGFPVIDITHTGTTHCEWLAKRISGVSQTQFGLSNITTSENLTSEDAWECNNSMMIDLTQMFGSTIADYIYSLEQANAGAGVAWFKKLFPNDYYAYNAGELLSAEGLQSHDSVGFNQWDEEWEVGDINATTGANASGGFLRSKNYIHIFPNTRYYVKIPVGAYLYYYDANKNYLGHSASLVANAIFDTIDGASFMRFVVGSTYGTTYNHDICINLSNPTRNGEYEPYEKHSYPLDSSLTLRGIPKLDASNNLYYDGDEYTSDGKVTRKYGVVDLGTITWVQGGGNNKTSWVPVSWRTNVKPVQNTEVQANILCGKYKTDTSEHVEKQVNDKTIAVNRSSWVYIYDSAYISVTPQEFKAAMSGVMLVYELATPTTETAQAYTNPQIVSKYGTLEYVTNSIVPVGHKTTYLTRDIFGGYVDLISGKLVVDKAMVVFDGTQSDFGVDVLSGFTQVSWTGYIPIGIASAEFVSDTFEFDKTTAGVGKIYASPTAPRMYFGMPTSITSPSEAQEWFRQHPTSVVYPLATPQTYQLTPQQVNTLVGTNNVWSEQGNIELSYHIPITNLLVKRQDVDDVSGDWLTLYSQPISQASDMDFTFIDFLNQYGKTYKYALVPLLTQTQSGVEVEVEGGYTVSNEVQSVFDGVFIADSTGSQKCKANVGYGNVDMNQVVGSITPIGAKYPIIITNSHNQYHNGSISGTIVPDDYYFNGNLSRIDMVNKRNELEQFLTNKRVKVIKDWNGNIWLVMIAGNVSCTFNNNYGMGIVSFSTNWTEVGDPTNQQDLQATGLINVGGV